MHTGGRRNKRWKGASDLAAYKATVLRAVAFSELESFQPSSEVIVSDDQVLTFLSWVVAVLFVAVTVYLIWGLNRIFQLLCVQSTPSEINDDNAVVSYFLELLSEAQDSMIVYDDGNSMEKSVYNDDRVIGAVHSKLQDSPRFELRCLFNCDDDLAFRKEFVDHQRVDIRTRSSQLPASEVHYKIIDGGAKAYLSRHAFGAAERRFKVVDCTTVRKGHRDRVANIVLGRYTKHFEQAFEASARSS